MSVLAHKLCHIFKRQFADGGSYISTHGSILQNTIAMACSAFGMFQSLMACSETFDWGQFPKLTTFVRLAPIQLGQLVGAFSLRDLTWLQITAEPDSSEVASQLEDLNLECSKFPQAFAQWLCAQPCQSASGIERIAEGALAVLEDLKFEVDYTALLHMIDALALIRSFVVEIQCDVPGRDAWHVQHAQFQATGGSNP
eukprot:Skav201237  [mRNA]  locus=scaffold3524:2202:2795:+ [translate_table: standard]